MRKPQAVLALILISLLGTGSVTRKDMERAAYWEAMEVYIAHEQWTEALLDGVKYAQEGTFSWFEEVTIEERETLRLCRLAEISVSLERQREAVLADGFIYTYQKQVRDAHSSMLGAALHILVEDEMNIVCNDGQTTGQDIAQLAVQMYEQYQPDLLHLSSDETELEQLKRLAHNEPPLQDL